MKNIVTYDSFIGSLNKMQVILMDKIHEINYGGCYNFAYYMQKRLAKLGIDSKVCCLSEIGDTCFNLKEYNKNKKIIDEIIIANSTDINTLNVQLYQNLRDCEGIILADHCCIEVKIDNKLIYFDGHRIGSIKSSKELKFQATHNDDPFLYKLECYYPPLEIEAFANCHNIENHRFNDDLLPIMQETIKNFVPWKTIIHKKETIAG